MDLCLSKLEHLLCFILGVALLILKEPNIYLCPKHEYSYVICWTRLWIQWLKFGDIHDWAGWGSEQPDLVLGVHCKGSWNRWYLKVPSKKILWFYLNSWMQFYSQTGICLCTVTQILSSQSARQPRAELAYKSSVAHMAYMLHSSHATECT